MSTFILKLIAIITMVIDHTGSVLFPDVFVFRLIGRIAFPIFAFLTAEACRKTSNPERHLLRLGLFALISEIPFDMAIEGVPFYWAHQNVFFTLFLASATIYCCEKLKGKAYWMAPFLAGFILGEFVAGDYGGLGVALIFAIFYSKAKWQIALALIGINLLFVFSNILAYHEVTLWGTMQAWAVLALVPIFCYNGERGPKHQLFFYLFYPCHLILLYLIHQFIVPII